MSLDKRLFKLVQTPSYYKIKGKKLVYDMGMENDTIVINDLLGLIGVPEYGTKARIRTTMVLTFDGDVTLSFEKLIQEVYEF